MKLATIGAISLLTLTSFAAVAGDINRAKFNKDGSVNQPNNWRAWVFVGSPLTPNALNGGMAAFPEFHNVYVEPSAFEAYSRTGKWPDGTQFAKELTKVRTGSNCNKDNGACAEVSGMGYFNGEFSGLELAVKDSKRFSDEPGNWAYFTFGHKAPPYNKTAEAMPTEACNGCHEKNAGEDFVFNQFYPVLKSAKSSR